MSLAHGSCGANIIYSFMYFTLCHPREITVLQTKKEKLALQKRRINYSEVIWCIDERTITFYTLLHGRTVDSLLFLSYF